MLASAASEDPGHWAFLGPGNHGPDACAAVLTVSGKPLAIFTESKLHQGSGTSAEGPDAEGSHPDTVTVASILSELRKDVSKFVPLPTSSGNPLTGVFGQRFSYRAANAREGFQEQVSHGSPLDILGGFNMQQQPQGLEK